MAAIADPLGELDLKKLARDLDDCLPSYARPMFLRFMNDLDITSKSNNIRLVKIILVKLYKETKTNEISTIISSSSYSRC